MTARVERASGGRSRRARSPSGALYIGDSWDKRDLNAVAKMAATLGVGTVAMVATCGPKTGLKLNVRPSLGPSAGELAADDFTRVGRAMSPHEHAAMVATGDVEVTGSGMKSVARPPDITALQLQAQPGSVHVEFDVPTSALRHADRFEWAQIPSPEHPLLGRLAERTGVPRRSPVPACNIVVVGSC